MTTQGLWRWQNEKRRGGPQADRQRRVSRPAHPHRSAGRVVGRGAYASGSVRRGSGEGSGGTDAGWVMIEVTTPLGKSGVSISECMIRKAPPSIQSKVVWPCRVTLDQLEATQLPL